MAQDFKGILIATPCYGGGIKMQTHAAISQVRSALSWGKVPNQEYILDMCDIEDVRNSIVTFWYDNLEYDHLLMIDNDMHFDPSLIFKMIELNKPVVGVTYHKRQMAKDGDVRGMVIGETLAGYPEIVNGFQPWKYVGGGIMLIKRDVVTQMLKKFPEINGTVDPGALGGLGVTRMIGAFSKMKDPSGRPLSEDYSFCERWTQCGGEIWCGVEYPVGHIGSFTYGFHMYGKTIPELLGLKPPAEVKAA